MEMQYPAPRQSKFGPSGGTIDYSSSAPEGSGRVHPCSGKPAGPVTATFAAGSSLNVKIVGSAPHGGGHCQFSMSYDKGTTFVVIQDALGTCPLEGSYSVKIPAGAPSGQAIFAWSWINAVGNREYYMNCADVQVTGGGNGFSGPKMLVANLPGFPTIPEFKANANAAADLFSARPVAKVGGGGTAAPSSGSTPQVSASASAKRLLPTAQKKKAKLSTAEPSDENWEEEEEEENEEDNENENRLAEEEEEEEEEDSENENIFY